jgi:nitrogen-specific signal transduction histidine kinase
MSTPAGVLFIPDGAPLENGTAAPMRALDRIAHLAALATHATIAQINLVSDHKQIPVAFHVDEARAALGGVTKESTWRAPIDLAPSYSFLDLDGHESLAIEDTRVHSQAQASSIEASDRVRSYAATRLRTPDGVVVGTVCVIDCQPREWSSDDRAALAECAALAGEELASHLTVVATERSHVEAEQSRRDLDASRRAKSAFLAVFSRDLRAQLDTLSACAALLETEARKSALAESEELRRVQLVQRQLTSLIDQTLNYSSLEQGAADLTLARVPVRGAMVEAESAVAPQSRAKAIFLTLGDLREDLAVSADAARLREILMHLLSNAVKYTGAGGRIDMGCDATRTHVRIRVRDTGIGIPADKVDVIFEPFVRLGVDLDRSAEDAGLGLAISRALARAQGGDLTVESTVASGSTFTLTLPRAKPSL